MATDVYQLTVVGQSAGQFFENVLHFTDGATSNPDPTTQSQDLINSFISEVEPQLVDCMAADSSITGYKAKRVNNGGSPTIAVPQTPVPGTIASTSATSATASLILVPFIRTGQFYTGKIFVPGLSEADLTGNVIGTAQRTRLATFTGALETFSIGSTTWDYVIWSRTVSLPFVPYDFNVSAKVGIQRRRLKPVM